MRRNQISRLLAAWAVIMAACGTSGSDQSDTRAFPSSSTVSHGSTTTTAVTTTSISGSTTTATTVPDRVLGLITPNGIPVAILRQAAEGQLVMTPCGLEAEVSEGEPLGRTTVVLDPGHGGPSDTGAVGRNGLAEKEVNLEVALHTADFLEERGISTVLTRTADYTSPLFVRANLADTLNAELMVSIHHNAPTPGPSTEPGVEIFVQRQSAESARLGGLLWEHTTAGLSVFDVSWAAAEDAGVMTVLNSRGDDAYGIIRHPATPTALVELGYISNPPEAELFSRPVYAPAAGLAIAEAIVQFLMSDDAGSGYVEGRIFDPQPGVGQDVCTDPDLD